VEIPPNYHPSISLLPITRVKNRASIRRTTLEKTTQLPGLIPPVHSFHNRSTSSGEEDWIVQWKTARTRS
jgi:hypothetical protein